MSEQTKPVVIVVEKKDNKLVNAINTLRLINVILSTVMIAHKLKKAFENTVVEIKTKEESNG